MIGMAVKQQKKPVRRYVPTCCVCSKVLKPFEWPSNPKDPGLCDEHAREYQRR